MSQGESIGANSVGLPTAEDDPRGSRELPLLPMQRYYGGQPGVLKRLMLPALFEVSSDVDPAALEDVLRAVWSQHDALRTRLLRDGPRWRMRIDPFEAKEDLLTLVDASDIPTGEIPAAVRQVMADAADECTTEGSRLCQAFLFERVSARTRMLVMLTHHMMSDAWSQFLLARDLARGWTNWTRTGAATLPPKTTDLATWARMLEQLGASGAFEDELGSWLEGEEVEPALDTSAPWGSAPFQLTAVETARLRTQGVTAHGADVSELVAAATGLALARWSRAKRVGFDWLVGGRTHLPAGIDLSRTVGVLVRGWPHTLVIEPGMRAPRVVPLVRHYRSRVSHLGLGHAVLANYGRDRALRERLDRLPGRRIRVNYLGTFQRMFDLADTTSFRRRRPDLSLHPHPESHAAVELRFLVLDDRLVGFVCCRGDERNGARALSDHLAGALRELIA